MKSEQIIYNKLIRDRIPEIVKANGWIAVTKKLDKKQYIIELKRKILEEAKELNEGNGTKNLIEELADIQEIIDAVLTEKKIKFTEFRKIQATKRKKRGGFKKQLFLLKTTKKIK